MMSYSEYNKSIFVNNKKIYVKEDELHGKEILALAGFEPEKYDLFLVHGQESKRIEDDQLSEIKNDMRFTAILTDVAFG